MRISKRQGRGALAIDADRARHPLEPRSADGAIVTAVLDVQETSIGLKADLPQGRQMLQPFAQGEVTGVVDGGLSA